MSFHPEKSVPYLLILATEPKNRKLYRLILKEVAGEFLIKSLSELALNLIGGVVEVPSAQIEKNSSLLTLLASKRASLTQKRKLLLSRGFPVIPKLIRASWPALKQLPAVETWLKG